MDGHEIVVEATLSQEERRRHYLSRRVYNWQSVLYWTLFLTLCFTATGLWWTASSFLSGLCAWLAWVLFGVYAVSATDQMNQWLRAHPDPFVWRFTREGVSTEFGGARGFWPWARVVAVTADSRYLRLDWDNRLQSILPRSSLVAQDLESLAQWHHSAKQRSDV